MLMNTPKVSRSFGTHDGTFHADEVTACALLLLFKNIDADKIVRTRDLELLRRCEYVCDVGGIYDSRQKLFDHHQVEYKGNMSSAGMVLLYLHESGILNAKEYDFFNRMLIQGVDAHDNGKDPQLPGVSTYSHIIASFNPVLHNASPSDIQNGFFAALEFAYGFLERQWQRYQYTQSCRQIVSAAMERGERYLIFDQSIPWMDIFFELDGEHHPALFVIMPSDKHWKLRGIPPTLETRMQVRLPLPLEWAGLLEEDLRRVSDIPGAIFCHKGRFISVWETREEALKALEYTLQDCKRHR